MNSKTFKPGDTIRVRVRYTVEETLEYNWEDFDLLANDSDEVTADDILESVRDDMENPQDTGGWFSDRECMVEFVKLQEEK